MRPPIFSVTPMRSSGSRVDWKIVFVSFTKLIPRKIFSCIAKILVLMVTNVSKSALICLNSERAKGAEKASCRETVVQKSVFGESVSSLPPYEAQIKHMKNFSIKNLGPP